MLSPDEQLRALAFRSARDGWRFAVRRGWLRHLLGAAMGIAPEDLTFAVGEYGKPFLPDCPALHFSLSQSDGVALAAVGDSPLGCDIEACVAANADPLVTERLYSAAERAALAGLSGRAWVAAFFDIWVRKEALGKALGTGLSAPPDALCTVAAPGWRLERIAAPAGFAAALATRD